MADPEAVQAAISANVPVSIGGRLAFSWGAGTELRLCEIQNPGSGTGGVEPFKSVVTWSAPSASHKALAYAVAPSQDELVHNGASTDLQKDAVSPELRSFARAVRAALARERGAADCGGLIGLEHAVWQLLEVFFIDAACSEGYVAEDLAVWLADNAATLSVASDGCSLDDRLAALLASPRPDVLGDYWPCMDALVATARGQDALTLLAAHDAMAHGGGSGGGGAHESMLPQYELLDATYVLLRQMPRFQPAGARMGGGDGGRAGASSGPSGREFDNMAEFLSYRAQWQAQVRDLPSTCAELFSAAERINRATAEGVRRLLVLLGGDDETALERACGSWLELLVAQLVHVRPNSQARRHLRPLLSHVRAAMPDNGGASGGPEVLPLFGDLLEAAADLEVQRVVEVLSTSGAVSPWFMAHMYEVMRAAPRTGAAIDRPLPRFGGDQVEYWRLLFAEMLACQPGSVGLAVRYLSWCPVYGAAAAEAVLEAQPMGRDAPAGAAQTDKLLQLATSHGLSATAAALCRTAGASAWASGRVGDAAAWLLRARDERRLAVVLEAVTNEVATLLAAGVGTYHVIPLGVAAAEQLEVLVASLLPSADSGDDGGAASPSPAVRLLEGVLRLQRAQRAIITARDAGDMGAEATGLRAASSAAMDLATCGATPRSLGLPLLFHLIPLLEAPYLAFTLAELHALLRWLTDLELAAGAGAMHVGMHPRHVKDVRLALARALARAHIDSMAEGGA